MPPIKWEKDQLKRRCMYQQLPIKVYDARRLAQLPTLERNGFTLVNAPSKITDYDDQQQVTTVLYNKFEDLVKRLTNCVDVTVTQHQYRNGYGNLNENHPSHHRPTANGSEGSYAGIHSDVTPWSESGWKNLVNGRHFQVYNLWCSTRPEGTIEVMPLSICDMNSVDPDDMICADSWGQSDTRARLVSYRLVSNENQRWFYFPHMTPGEVLVFKQYDTMQEKPNMRCTFHGAVNNRDIKDDEPLRETIEVRLIALFQKEIDKESRVRRFQNEIPPENPAGNTSTWVTMF